MASAIGYVASANGHKLSEKFLSDWGLALVSQINVGAAHFLRNKLVFHRYLQHAAPQVTCPELIAFLRDGHILDAKPPHHILTVEQLRERCPDYFLKPIWGNRGRGIKRVNNGEVPSSKGRGNASVIVRTVPQPEYSYTISPVSWNTVRAVVMRMPKTREIFLPIAVHRFGTLRTAPVDNWSQDELSCEIDIQSGRMGVGIGHPSEFDGALVKHSINPDTGNPLDGVVIPHWNDAVSLVKALMDVFPEIDVAGWDLLPVDGGWCVIEGNDQMDIDLLKVHRGLLAYERVREFIAHHFPKYWRVKLHS